MILPVLTPFHLIHESLVALSLWAPAATNASDGLTQDPFSHQLHSYRAI